jgi:hypothetical protein
LEEEEAKKKKKKPKPKKKVKKKKKTKAEDENNPPPITALSFKFSKVDMGTILALFMSSTEIQMPTSIKFWQCNLSPRAIQFIVELLSLERSLMDKLFFHHNSFGLEEGTELSPSPYLGLFNPLLKLKMVSLNQCNLSNSAVKAFLSSIYDFKDCEDTEE